MVKSKTYLNYIHNFRGVAILFVVGGHILYGWQDKTLGYQIINSTFQNGTVLFIFIAGYLFQHLSSRFEYKSYLTKKFENVIIPYLIVSAPIIYFRIQSVPDYILEDQPAYGDWSIIHKVVYLLTTGAHLLPLWFVPMITLFYLIAPVLIYIDRHSQFYKVLPILIIVSLLVPRGDLEDIPRMFVHFLSVYVFGMFCSRYKDEVLEFSIKWWKPMTALTVVLIGISYIEWRFYDQVMYIQKMMLCWFFIYWLWKIDEFVPKTIAFLAEISFGIFFIHHYFVIGLRYFQLNVLHLEINNVFFYWTLHFVITIGLTSALIVLVRKVAGKRSRVLIGC